MLRGWIKRGEKRMFSARKLMINANVMIIAYKGIGTRDTKKNFKKKQ